MDRKMLAIIIAVVVVVVIAALFFTGVIKTTAIKSAEEAGETTAEVGSGVERVGSVLSEIEKIFR